MNNEAEIVQAMQDFQSGRMGEITRTAEVTPPRSIAPSGKPGDPARGPL